MKTRNLIAMAVASTFGWSAATFAGAGHEVVTPFSPNESGPVIFSYEEGFGSRDQSAALAESLAMDESLAFDDEALAMDESIALGDEGIYADYYLVSLTPMTLDTWDYYIIDTGMTPDELAAGEEIYFVSPAYDVAWVPVTFDVSAFPSESGEEAPG